MYPKVHSLSSIYIFTLTPLLEWTMHRLPAQLSYMGSFSSFLYVFSLFLTHLGEKTQWVKESFLDILSAAFSTVWAGMSMNDHYGAMARN